MSGRKGRWVVAGCRLALAGYLGALLPGCVCADGLLNYTYSGRLLNADGSGPAAGLPVGTLSYDSRLASADNPLTQQPPTTTTSGEDGTFSGAFTGSSLGGCGPAWVVLREELDRVFVNVLQGDQLLVLDVRLTRSQQQTEAGVTHISLPDIYVSQAGLSLTPRQ